MPKFSTFSIYEDEVRKYIRTLRSHIALDKEELTNWFYGEGVNELRKGQAVDYYAFVKECQSKFLHRPLISIHHSLGQHYAGLTAVQSALVKEFGQNDAARENIIREDFNSLVISSIDKHKEFIKIETEISSEFNDYLDNNGDLSPAASLKKVIEMFELKRDQYPDLYTEFKNKLTLMNEFLDELSKKNTNQFFNPGINSQPGLTHQSITLPNEN
ncbi:hypothetical protein TUM19329_33030 [Legionella antarctica]|uniref:Uncharacterized protein n=1 Tax=Legionella antarctica TaxID=2708020 RepID=A0A6F8TA55_9GAMM|nr:hypothetical protein [Legionella antarctica]BCA96942.1 hypothetical protein TUM19329_33030 [Legionella antarctica]